MATTPSILTAAQLREIPNLGRCELVQGELIMMSPAGYGHGQIASRIDRRLGNFVDANRLGVVTTAEAGFQIAHNPDTVRVPDVAFVRAARAPAQYMTGFFPGPPDLAVEVVSPTDRPAEVEAKSREWLAAGCRMVWVVDPQTATVAVYRPNAAVCTLRVPEILDGDDVLAGFRLPLAEIFGG